MFGSFAAFTLLHLAATVSGLAVPLQFYTSKDCEKASNSTPTAAFDLDVCVVSPGLVSLHYDTVPCAGGGNARPVFFDDTSCGSETSGIDYYKTGDDFQCLSAFAQDSVAAFMLSCTFDKSTDDNLETATATTTATIGPVATGNNVATSTSAGGSSDSPNGPGESIRNAWNRLHIGARIGIIAGAAAFVLLLLACCLCVCCRRKNKNRDFPRVIGLNLPSPPPQDPEIAQPHKGPHISITPLSPVVNRPPVPTWEDLSLCASNAAEALAPGAISDVLVYDLETGRPAEYEVKVGALGELYIYNLLCRFGSRLFGIDRWESKNRNLFEAFLRLHAPREHQNFELRRFEGIADFKYIDGDGTFTDFLQSRGLALHGIDGKNSPTYFIEVKSTERDSTRHFHMSPRQIENAHLIGASHGHQNSAYLIFRVFNLGQGTSTGFHIYDFRDAERELSFEPKNGGYEVRPFSSWTNSRL